MIKKLSCLLLLSHFFALAQAPIFSPTSNITGFGSVSSPPGETYQMVIDGDINTKYLDFGYSDGIGFTVNLGSVQKTATSIAITTANDSPGRDPMNYEIWGSNNGSDYTSITSGSITCNPTRFNTTTYTFTNTQAYSYYQLVFTNECTYNEQTFQIAEVQLFENPLSSQDFYKDDFAVYPNPNNGIFSVNSSNENSTGFITVTDALGTQIKQLHYNGNTSTEMNLQGFASGLYFAQITSEYGSVVKKIIIK